VKVTRWLPALLLLSAAAASLSLAADNQPAALRQFLVSFEDATSRFINGDAAAWKRLASHRDDVTIMGAWGAYEKSWREADARYDWAAARFRESGAKVNVEYLASEQSGDLAYTVAIERSTVRLVDQSKPAPMALRVTHVFRKEDGNWKLVHRHADPIIGKTAPSATLQTEGDPLGHTRSSGR
jgi:ketosteroid isomerase-like protein